MTEMLVTAEQMKRIDKHAIEQVGIPSMVLMERAALSVTEELLLTDLQTFLVVCGTGNNGGDGVAVARMLYLKGREVTLLVIGEKEKYSEETKQQLQIAKKIGLTPSGNIEAINFSSYDGIVEALFGVGLNRPIEGIALTAVKKINEANGMVWSMDIASGISADTGEVLGEAVKADGTVTFGWQKVGMSTIEGAAYSGQVYVKDIGYPEVSYEYGMK
jgi:NAD(P)H-hydrate epimerase